MSDLYVPMPRETAKELVSLLARTRRPQSVALSDLQKRITAMLVAARLGATERAVDYDEKVGECIVDIVRDYMNRHSVSLMSRRMVVAEIVRVVGATVHKNTSWTLPVVLRVLHNQNFLQDMTNRLGSDVRWDEDTLSWIR